MSKIETKFDRKWRRLKCLSEVLKVKGANARKEKFIKNTEVRFC